MRIVEKLRRTSELWWLSILLWSNLALVSRVPAVMAAVTVLTCAAVVLAWPLAELIEVAIE